MTKKDAVMTLNLIDSQLADLMHHMENPGGVILARQAVTDLISDIKKSGESWRFETDEPISTESQASSIMDRGGEATPLVTTKVFGDIVSSIVANAARDRKQS